MGEGNTEESSAQGTGPTFSPTLGLVIRRVKDLGGGPDMGREEREAGRLFRIISSRWSGGIGEFRTRAKTSRSISETTT